MQGQMMHRDLRIIDILTHAAEAHCDQGIVSARVEGDVHRQSYGQTSARVAQLAHALEGLGVGTGDRVGTLSWPRTCGETKGAWRDPSGRRRRT